MEPFHADWFGQYKYDSFCMQSLHVTSTYYWWLLRLTITIRFDSKFQIIAQLFNSISFEMRKTIRTALGTRLVFDGNKSFVLSLDHHKTAHINFFSLFVCLIPNNDIYDNNVDNGLFSTVKNFFRCCIMNLIFIRPPGTVVPGGLMFCCGFFLWHFAALYLWDGWGDRPETFTHDWKCVNLDFGGLKFGGRGPKKIWRATAFFPI